MTKTGTRKTRTGILSGGINHSGLNVTHLPIQFEIQMPAGTKGLLTSNWQESEFITQPGTSIEIMGAEVYNDGAKDCVRILSRLIQE